MPIESSRKYLDPLVLSKLANMELVARCAVEGFFTGLHPSPFYGFSVEYSDHRSYQPGDELKFLDWKAFGRSDKLYIKQFHQETNVTVTILLDSSKSMSFASEGSVSKLDYGSYLASALAYLMLGQADSVSLVLFNEKVTRYIPARSRHSHLRHILRALQHNHCEGQTDLASVLHTLAERSRRKGLVILISDFLDDVSNIQKGLAHLKYLRNDVILFHTLDRQELELDYRGLIQFEGLETDERIQAFPESIRDAYRKQVAEFIDTLANQAGQSDIDYYMLNTSLPLDKALLTYLSKRKQMF